MHIAKISQHIPYNYYTIDHQNASTWVEIDSKALAHNILQYKMIVGQNVLAPVIKSNAYGHGLAEIAQLLDTNEHVAMMCVVSLREALYLRMIGIKKPLLVLSIFDAPLELIVQHADISVVVYDLLIAQKLHEIARQAGKKINIHIKVDTGLSRLGILIDHAYDVVSIIKKLDYLEIEGIFTHLAHAESSDQTFTKQQVSCFNSLLEQLEHNKIKISLQHVSCSAALTAHDATHCTLNRVGIGIYGLWSSSENYVLTKQCYPSFTLKPVLTWKTKIAQLKQVPAHTHVGYDLTFTTQRATKIAVLPVGYWDGLNRNLSNKGCVFINNQRASIIGRIAMNLTMVDVTDIDIEQSDQVTLLGCQQGITAENIATACGTINYEIVTRINPLLPRIIR